MLAGCHAICIASRTVVLGRRSFPHLITARRVESALSLPHPPFARYLHLSLPTMAEVTALTKRLESLQVNTITSISHTEATTPAAWREAIQASDAPKGFQLVKVLVFKPKTAKNATPVPVVVIAKDETETSSGALGKKLNLKELRLASEDLLQEFFSADKNSRAPLYLALGPISILTVLVQFLPSLLPQKTFQK